MWQCSSALSCSCSFCWSSCSPSFLCHRVKWWQSAGSSKSFVTPYLGLKYSMQGLFLYKSIKILSLAGSHHTSRTCIKFLYAKTSLSIALIRKSWYLNKKKSLFFAALWQLEITWRMCVCFYYIPCSRVWVQGISWRLTTGWEGLWIQEAAQGTETGC